MRLLIFSSFLFLLAGFSFAGNYNIDKAHSNVGFEVTHMVITTVTGKFTDFDVDLNWNPDDLAASAVNANIKIASVDTDQQKRDDHLRTGDFFDAENHPEMIFKSNKITKSDKGYTAHGTLLMRGVSKAIELPFIVKGPVNDSWGNQRIGVTAETTVNRQDWGVSYGSVMDNGGLVISDNVVIKINAQFIKKKDADL
jgi:polyisoprenoid-binding protein YceI